MIIKWLGHASFLISSKGINIITDPINEKSGYPVVPRSADIVTISHQHWDHNATEGISGMPRVFEGAGRHELDGVIISGINSFHDKNQGRDRGTNTIFKISAEGINVVHLGDLGHIPGSQQVEEIGLVDVLLIPVGGVYTVDAEEACEIVELLKPRLVIPMHYQTPHLSFTLAPVENFISRYDRVLKLPCLEIEASELIQEEPGIIVLDYLLG